MHMIVLVRYLNEVLFFTGCYSCSLYLFLCLPDRASIFGYWPRVSGTWLRYLHSNLHTAAVLLLRRMAQGKLAFWAGDGGTLPGGWSRCQICDTYENHQWLLKLYQRWIQPEVFCGRREISGNTFSIYLIDHIVRNGHEYERAHFTSTNAATTPQGSITPTRSQNLNYKLKKPFSYSILQWGSMAADLASAERAWMILSSYDQSW